MQKIYSFAFADSDPGSVNAINGIIDILNDSNFQFKIKRYHYERGRYFIDEIYSTYEQVVCDFKSFKADFLFVGTSVESPLEYELLKLASVQRIGSMAFIDHWINYKLRFERNEYSVFPDIIVVNDDIAYQQAISDGLPASKIKIFGNPWWYVIKKSRLVAEQNRAAVGKVLFISDNINETWGSETKNILGFTEFEVLNDLINILEKLKKEFQLKIRLHPKDTKNKYSNLLGEKKINIDFDNDSLVESVTSADLVIGMFSSAVLEAVGLGGRVIRYEPGGDKDLLPSSRIQIFHSKKMLCDFMRSYFDGNFNFISSNDTVFDFEVQGFLNYMNSVSVE